MLSMLSDLGLSVLYLAGSPRAAGRWWAQWRHARNGRYGYGSHDETDGRHPRNGWRRRRHARNATWDGYAIIGENGPGNGNGRHEQIIFAGARRPKNHNTIRDDPRPESYKVIIDYSPFLIVIPSLVVSLSTARISEWHEMEL